ncbi:MAG: c-type cytochrome [Cyclobacteriaceae bacterium]
MKYRIPGLARISSLVLLISISLYSQAQDIPTDPASISAGEALFKLNCKTCHKVKEKSVGPALAGIEKRAPSIDWINNWVKNSAKVIASGDAYAVKIYEENGKSQMTAFTSLKDDQILSILAYVKSEAEKVEVAATTPAGGAQGGEQGGVPSSYLTVIMVGLLIVLILLLVVLGFIVSGLKRFLGQKELSEEDREVVDSGYTFGGLLQSKGFLFVVAFVVIAIGFKTVIDGLYTIGVQKGYQPKQPIAFSHKIHAGQYDIDCKYCHTGVTKGKSANIPSPNICMNCHSQIRTGTNTGEGEIAKIYAAVQNNKPIEWVRIHNLPDLAYFNHQQHVVVGNIECQKCHGPVQEMDVVKQYSLLTMGWCIDCHRKTDVNSKGNAYYDKLEEVHQAQIKSGKKDKGNMKVEDIGGLECGKCHY